MINTKGCKIFEGELYIRRISPLPDMYLDHKGKRRTEACIVFESAALRVTLRCLTCANSLGRRLPDKKSLIVKAQSPWH